MFEQIRDEKRTAANTAYRIGTAYLVLLELIRNMAENIGEEFLHSNEEDVAHELIKFLKGAEFGAFSEGIAGAYISKFGDAEFRNLKARLRATVHDLIVGTFEHGVEESGARIDEKGNAEFEELITRALATLAQLEVLGDSVFHGSLSSEDFISGFLGGKGWSIKKNEYTNTAGETEYKYTLEVDNVTARGILRVYEMVASQMRGENDNVTFSARMKVHHYDAKTGKVWLDTEGEQLMCVFKADDCIMVQRYQPGNTVVEGGNGYITKNYELIIDEWGIGGETNEAGERLDWIKFRNFTTQMENGTASGLIERGDTFTRVDNLSDPERKGIIQIMTVGENRPHIDIIHSLKTDPDNALKGRLGNLEGIRHHLFGWLKGFGEYLINAYIVGDVRLRRTGESLDTLVEIVNGRLASRITDTVYELTDDDNFIKNATFSELNADGSLKDWIVSNDDIGFLTVAGSPVVSSVGTSVDVRSAVKTIAKDGKMVLHIVNGSVTQLKDVMKVPGTHKEYDEGSSDEQTSTYRVVPDTLYLAIRLLVKKNGILSIGFPSSQETAGTALKSKTVVLEKSSDWVTYQWSGTWDGQTNFVLSFTGEAYISLLSLTTEPLSTFKTEYATQIRQTARNISLIATKASSNATDIASLTIEATRIRSTVESNYTDLDGRVTTNASAIVQTATEIRLEVQTVSDDLLGVTGRVGTLEVHDSSITARVTSVETTVSTHSDDIEGLHGDVTSITNRIGELEVTDTNITARVSSVETSTAQHTTDISGLSSDISGLDDRLDTAEDDIVSVTTRVGELEVTDTNITARVSTVETRSANNATNISSLSTRVGNLEVSDTNISARVSTVETRSSNNATSISDLGGRMNTAESNISSANSNISSLTTRVSSLELTDSSISGRVSAVEGRVSQINDVAGWEQGSTNGESEGKTYDQVKYNTTIRIRTKGYYPVTAASACFLSAYGAASMKVGFVYFNSSKKICSASWGGWWTGSKISVNAPSNCAYVAVLLAYQNDSNISVSDVLKSGISITSDRVVSEGEISLMVTKDNNGYISNASIKADNIDFTFNRSTNFVSNNTTVMSIDTSGNLWIKGEYRGGSITQNVTIGTGTKKMVIEPTSTGARLVGRDGTKDVISVGFQNYGNVAPYLNINNGASGNSFAYTQMDYNSLSFGAGSSYYLKIQYNNSGRIAIHGNWSSWYKDTELSNISKGDVYVDGDGFLKVKNY